MKGGGGGGGYRSRFTESKTALSQFTRKKINIGISRFAENKIERFGKSRFTATMEITIHEEKKPFHISRDIKRADHGSRKYPLPLSKFVPETQKMLLIFVKKFLGPQQMFLRLRGMDTKHLVFRSFAHPRNIMSNNVSLFATPKKTVHSPSIFSC